MREEKPYTLEEANWAGGVGVDNRQRNKPPVEKMVEDKEVEAAL